jgi:two-component system CheB/CheR fusion protein
MPRSAIATGLVDYELPPAEMPAQLIAYAAHAFGKLPPTPAGPDAHDRKCAEQDLVLLRAQVGHDFSQYKPSYHPAPDRAAHGRPPDRNPRRITSSICSRRRVEVEALFRDLLIGVTHFFRDPAAFRRWSNR